MNIPQPHDPSDGEHRPGSEIASQAELLFAFRSIEQICGLQQDSTEFEPLLKMLMPDKDTIVEVEIEPGPIADEELDSSEIPLIGATLAYIEVHKYSPDTLGVTRETLYLNRYAEHLLTVHYEPPRPVDEAWEYLVSQYEDTDLAKQVDQHKRAVLAAKEVLMEEAFSPEARGEIEEDVLRDKLAAMAVGATVYGEDSETIELSDLHRLVKYLT